MQIISRKEAIAQGLSWYFTGKPCWRGHIDERYVDGGCSTCRKMRYQLNIQKNRGYGRRHSAKLALAYRVLRELGIEI